MRENKLSARSTGGKEGGSVLENGGVYVTDKVANFVEDDFYALNCILFLSPRTGLFPKKLK